MSIFLLRHGALQPQRVFIGAQDISLSALGLAQARAWAQWWQDSALAGIVSSDLCRCVETANIIARHRDIPLHRDARLREICLGDWQGLNPQQVEQRFPDQYARRGQDMAHFRPPHGESFTDLAQRVLPAFDHWCSHFGPAPWLLVGHGGVNRVIIARHMALPLSHVLDIPQPYACCTQLD